MARPFGQLHDVHPRQAFSQISFFFCVVVGIAGSILLKSLGLHPFLVATYAALILFVYAAVAMLGGSLRLEPENIGDNCYYMGFLFTLASLAYTLYQMSNPALNGGRAVDIPAVISGFGVALSSTIVGVFLRVLLMQMRPDFVTKEREVRADMNRSFAEFRRTMSQMLRQMKAFSTESIQMTSERDERIRTETERFVANHHDKLLIASEQFNTSLKEVMSTTVADALTRVENSIERTGQQSIQAIEAASAKAVEALDQASSRNIEAISQASTRSTSTLSDVSEKSLSAITRASAQSGEAIDIACRTSVDAIERSTASSVAAIDSASSHTLSAIETSAKRSVETLETVAADIVRMKDELAANEAHATEAVSENSLRIRGLLERQERLLASYGSEVEKSVEAIRRLSDAIESNVSGGLEGKLAPALDALAKRLERLGHDTLSNRAAPIAAETVPEKQPRPLTRLQEPSVSSTPAMNPSPSATTSAETQETNTREIGRGWLRWGSK